MSEKNSSTPTVSIEEWETIMKKVSVKNSESKNALNQIQNSIHRLFNSDDLGTTNRTIVHALRRNIFFLYSHLKVAGKEIHTCLRESNTDSIDDVIFINKDRGYFPESLNDVLDTDWEIYFILRKLNEVLSAIEGPYNPLENEGNIPDIQISSNKDFYKVLEVYNAKFLPEMQEDKDRVENTAQEINDANIQLLHSDILSFAEIKELSSLINGFNNTEESCPSFSFLKKLLQSSLKLQLPEEKYKAFIELKKDALLRILWKAVEYVKVYKNLTDCDISTLSMVFRYMKVLNIDVPESYTHEFVSKVFTQNHEILDSVSKFSFLQLCELSDKK